MNPRSDLGTRARRALPYLKHFSVFTGGFISIVAVALFVLHFTAPAG